MVAGAAGRGAGPVTGAAGRVGGSLRAVTCTTKSDAIWRAVAVARGRRRFRQQAKSRAY
jgi:hypothetical protein